MLQDSLVSRPSAHQPAQLTDPASLGIGVLDRYMRVLCPLCLPHACVSTLVAARQRRCIWYQNSTQAQQRHSIRLSAAVSMQVDYASVRRCNAMPACCNENIQYTHDLLFVKRQ